VAPIVVGDAIYVAVERIEVKPDHVGQLLVEEGLSREFEASAAVRLQAE